MTESFSPDPLASTGRRPAPPDAAAGPGDRADADADSASGAGAGRAATATVTDTVEALVEWQREHQRRAGPIQRFADRATSLLGRPGALAVVIILTLAWIVANLIALGLGARPFERFPFPDLAFVATVSAFLLTLLILTAQRHAAVLADQRAQLTLLIAIQNEKRCAKLVELLMEMRRESPLLATRHDPEAAAMTETADLRETLARLRSTADDEG